MRSADKIGLGDMKLTDPSTLCLILLAASAVFVLIRTRGRLARERQRWAAEGSESRDYNGAGKTRSSPTVPDDLAEWEVEMHETARRLCGQLDAKLGLLQSLVVEADRAAARLEDALKRAYPALPPGSQAESLLPPGGQPRDSGGRKPPKFRDPPSDLEGAPADSDGCSSDGESLSATDRARRRAEVYRLADYGFATPEIAKRVGSPVGEVELILSLRETN